MSISSAICASILFDKSSDQVTWVAYIMDACGKNHGSHFQISQLVRKLIIRQKAPQRLCHIRRMYVVVIWVVVVGSLYVLRDPQHKFVRMQAPQVGILLIGFQHLLWV